MHRVASLLPLPCALLGVSHARRYSEIGHMLACPERFLTYGSSCQDCGFNNQRLDIERAAQIAVITNRTLVVRNILCSPHSPCPGHKKASGDAVIPTVGGVDMWRQATGGDVDRAIHDPPYTGAPGQIRWAAGVNFMPARHFFDEADVAMTTGNRFIWADDFHARHPALLGPAASSNWVLLGQNGSKQASKLTRLTREQKRACVWHAPHLHKPTTLHVVVNQLGLASSIVWSQPTQPIAYAAWLNSLANEVGQLASGGSGTRRGYACAHVRLGDWASHNGCVENCKFQPHKYAQALFSLVKQLWPPGVASSGRRSIFLATNRAPGAAFSDKDDGPMKPALSHAGFDVVTSSDLASRIQKRSMERLGALPTEDVVSCIEQLVCSRASVFVGTPGSSWTDYVKQLRSRRMRKSREPSNARPLGPSTVLSPVKFYSGVWQKVKTRRSIYSSYNFTRRAG